MSISNKQIEAIDASDLQVLVINQVMENRALEYKEALPGNSDDDKRELLADVSAFANASGGDLLYGIREDAGIAIEVCGLEVSDTDAEALRLQNIIRSGLDPKIPRVLIQSIPVENNRVVFLVRIFRSWALPHMVTFKNLSRFYKRHSNGREQLDVREIRDAFLFADTITERIRTFRHERLDMIAKGDTPINLISSGSYLVLHIIPIEAFDIASQFDIDLLGINFLRPLSTTSGTIRISGTGQRINFDGRLSFSIVSDESSTCGYTQTFRDGIIEAVDTTNTVQRSSAPYIERMYEHEVLAGLKRLLSVQQELGVQPPLFIGLSFLGVKGYRMSVEPKLGQRGNEPIDRDNLLVPEVVIEDYDVCLTDVMKPAFDTIWNASGWNCSPHYDSKGNWSGGSFEIE